MVPTIPGYSARVVAVANTSAELSYFSAQEQSLPDLSRVVLQIPLASSEDISSIAQQIEAVCISNSLPTWPKYSTHTFIEGNTIYVAYLKQGYQAQIAHLIPILIGIMIIGPVLLWLFSETFRDIVQLMVMIPIMLLMVKMTKSISKSEKPGPKKVKEKKPPFGERIDARLDKLGERVAKIGTITTSAVGTRNEVVNIISSISGIVRSVKAAPDTVMSGYDKVKVAERVSKIDRELKQYESHLSSEQLSRLEKQRAIVDELRSEY